jgi:hypothetical protein
VAVVSPAGSSASTDDWVVIHHVSGSDYAEHADWIRNGDHLVALLRATIDRACVMQTNGMTTTDVRRRALRAAGDFVPVVDEQRQFQRLIDRRAAIERVVAEAIETS